MDAPFEMNVNGQMLILQDGWNQAPHSTDSGPARPELMYQDTYCEDNGNIEDHYDDNTHQTLAECSALCDSQPNCAYFLFGIDQRTAMNRCTTQQRCENRRAYDNGGTTAIYSRARGTTGSPCTTPADMHNNAVLCDLYVLYQ